MIQGNLEVPMYCVKFDKEPCLGIDALDELCSRGEGMDGTLDDLVQASVVRHQPHLQRVGARLLHEKRGRDPVRVFFDVQLLDDSSLFQLLHQGSGSLLMVDVHLTSGFNPDGLDVHVGPQLEMDGVALHLAAGLLQRVGQHILEVLADALQGVGNVDGANLPLRPRELVGKETQFIHVEPRQ